MAIRFFDIYLYFIDFFGGFIDYYDVIWSIMVWFLNNLYNIAYKNINNERNPITSDTV